MLLVLVRADDKGVPAFCESQGKLICYRVCILRGYLPRLEALAYLVEQYIFVPGLLPSCDGGVLPFGKHKLKCCRARVALIGGNQFAVPRFARVLSIVETSFYGHQYTFALVYMPRHQP